MVAIPDHNKSAVIVSTTRSHTQSSDDNF